MSIIVKPRATWGGRLLIVALVAVVVGGFVVHYDTKAKAAAVAEHCASPETGAFSTKLACIARPSER